jgi:hypothetical protein
MPNGKTATVIISLILVVGYTIAGIADYQRGKDKRIIYSHRKEHHPVLEALFAHKIRLNEPVDKILSRWPPSRYSEHDNFTTLYYTKDNEETGPCCGGYSIYIQVIAIDTKLVKAMAVEGVLSEIEYVFFNDMDQVTDDYYWTSRLHYITAKR